MSAPVTGFRHPKGKRGWAHYMVQLTSPIFLSVELTKSFVYEYVGDSTMRNDLPRRAAVHRHTPPYATIHPRTPPYTTIHHLTPTTRTPPQPPGTRTAPPRTSSSRTRSLAGSGITAAGKRKGRGGGEGGRKGRGGGDADRPRTTNATRRRNMSNKHEQSAELTPETKPTEPTSVSTTDHTLPHLTPPHLT